jgi:hypothetical protein
MLLPPSCCCCLPLLLLLLRPSCCHLAAGLLLRGRLLPPSYLAAEVRYVMSRSRTLQRTYHIA